MNLFVQRDPGDVTPAEVSAILAEERLSGPEARERLISVWSIAMKEFLADDQLSIEELQYLDRLRGALNVSAREVHSAREELAVQAFQRRAAAAAADGKLTPEEHAELDRLAERLCLTENEAVAIYGVEAERVVADALIEYISDRRYSPADERKLQQLAAGLGAERGLEMDAETQQALGRMRLLWQVENGEMPECPVGISLRRGERCHLTFNAEWHEHRTRTVRVNYAGVGGRVRICKGVYFRAGTIAPQRITKTELTRLDGGTVYITNKRIIFDGHQANKSLSLTSLIGFEVFSNAIMLEKASGKPAYLIFDGDVELVATLLGGALALA